MGQSRLEEIKELIKSGFDLELISFELDIPLEQIKKLKEEIERPKISKSEVTKIDSESYYKMIQLKQKYRELFLENNNDQNNSKKEYQEPKILSPKEMEEIQTTIEDIRRQIQSMANLQKHERRAIAKEILQESKKIFKYELTIEQIEQLNILLNSKELQNIGMDKKDRTELYIKQMKRKLTEQLAIAVRYKQAQIMDITQLQELERKFIPFDIQGNEILVGGVRRELSSKISRMKQQSAVDRLRNDITPSIETVIIDLVNGNVDMQRANAIIDAEAKSRVDEKPKNRFSLTEEQEKRQILLQIRMAIREKADKYPIKNPEKAILSIQQLCGGELGFNISTVVRNLTYRKEFQTAKSICSRFSGEKVDPEIKAYIKILKDEIRNAEISELVLKGINQNETPEKEAQYFELIKKGLDMGNVKLSSISLGKNIDGSKNITLADIWPEQIQR